MAKLRLFLFTIILASAYLAAGDIGDEVLTLPEDASFPAATAEKLIRALNLLPNDPSPQPSAAVANAPPGSIVERPLRLSSFSSVVSADDLGHRAGYYRLPHAHDARMFYLFFESRQSKKDPVVIWLTGGPGCSSELAVFYENGPFHVADNMSLVWNEFGWDKRSVIIALMPNCTD